MPSLQKLRHSLLSILIISSYWVVLWVGATVATCAVTHSDDIAGIMLQYSAIKLNPDAMVDEATYDANKYTGNILLLQWTTDKIVPLSMLEALYAHYNKYTKHATMRVHEGQPHVFAGKYKVIAARDAYEFIQDNMKIKSKKAIAIGVTSTLVITILIALWLSLAMAGDMLIQMDIYPNNWFGLRHHSN